MSEINSTSFLDHLWKLADQNKKNSRAIYGTLIITLLIGISIGLVFSGSSSDLRYTEDEKVRIGVWESIEHAEINFEEKGVRLDCTPQSKPLDYGTIYKCSAEGVAR